MRSAVAGKLFAACLFCSVFDLVLVDIVVGPAALRPPDADAGALVVPTAIAMAITDAEATSAPSAASIDSAPARPSSPSPPAQPLSPPQRSGRRVVARFDSDQPSADDTELRKLAAAMLADPSAEIVLEGHTDQRGDPERNRMLSLERAKWAQNRLVELGVGASRIAVVGIGAERPRETGDGDAAIASNRRVEVRWISGTPPAEDGDR